MSDIKSYLFQTNAIKVCEENKPFWYTSGKIGPYFVNTHFIYGSEKDATELLNFIDDSLSNKLTLPQKVFNKVLNQYNTNTIYKNVIDTVKNYIEENIDVSEIDYISGGERRDWFFSNILSYLLDKPHITIYKDLSTYVSNSNFENTKEVTSLADKKVLHVADLITVASSYLRAWIPAIENLGSKICWSCSIVDRMQGGAQKIAEKGIKSLSLVNIDLSLFEKALELNVINENQLEMLKGFIENPDKTMKEFLINHPEFLENSLNSDEKTKKRAKLLIDGNLYGIN